MPFMARKKNPSYDKSTLGCGNSKKPFILLAFFGFYCWRRAVNTKSEADTIKRFNWSFSVIYIFRVAQQFLLHVHEQILFHMK
mgnify:CR=1 FL=1